MLNILRKQWLAGNSSSIILKNVCPMLVDTFLLNGGLYHIMFRLRFWERGGFWFSGCWYTLTDVCNHYFEGLLGIVGMHVGTMPHRMKFQLSTY